MQVNGPEVLAGNIISCVFVFQMVASTRIVTVLGDDFLLLM